MILLGTAEAPKAAGEPNALNPLVGELLKLGDWPKADDGEAEAPNKGLLDPRTAEPPNIEPPAGAPKILPAGF